EGLRRSYEVLDDSFHVRGARRGSIDPRACTVEIGRDGSVRVWSSCKVPYRLRRLLADLFELSPDKVVVERASIGGDFGAKGEVGPEAIAYALARATGRPIKIVRTYVEELQAGAPRHACVIRVRTDVKRDGTIVARGM